MPYLKVKLDHAYLKLQEIDDTTPLTWWRGCGTRRTAAVVFFRVYPYVSSLWEVKREGIGGRKFDPRNTMGISLLSLVPFPVLHGNENETKAWEFGLARPYSTIDVIAGSKVHLPSSLPVQEDTVLFAIAVFGR